MTQNKDHEMAAHIKLGLALLLNFLIPGVGNILLIGRTPGNVFCLILCIWAWTGHNPLITNSWMLLMAVKAVVDLYVMPGYLAKRHAEALKAGHKAAAEGANDGHLRGLSTPVDDAILPGHGYGEHGGASHGDHAGASSGDHAGAAHGDHAGAAHADHAPAPSGDHIKHAYSPSQSMHSNSAHASHPNKSMDLADDWPETQVPSGQAAHWQNQHGSPDGHTHAAPQPIHAVLPDPQNHGGPKVGLNAAHSTDEHHLSHGAPVPLESLHLPHEQAHGDAAAGQQFHLNAVHSNASHPPAPVPLQSLDQLKSHGAAAPISSNQENAGKHVEPQGEQPHATHGGLVNQQKVLDSLLHAAPGEAPAHEHHSALVNQHNVVDSLMHSQGHDDAAQAGHSHHVLKSEHADGPLPALEAEHSLSPSASSSDGDDAGVVFDIYGDGEETESTVSPFDDGFYHNIDGSPHEAASAAGSPAASPVDSGDSHSSHLKQVTYGASEAPAAAGGNVSGHKKVQLCLNCQRPREHNRPVCPTCGTHFEETSF